MIQTFFKYVSLTFFMLKNSILSAMEYRVSFVTQIVGMMINNLSFVLIWVIFFQSFPEVNGWRIQEILLLNAISSFYFGLVAMFGRGAIHLSVMISKGELDQFLTYPKNVLWQLSTSKTEISAIGDILFGVVLFFLSGYVSVLNFLFFLLLGLLTAIIAYSFVVITQSFFFFVEAKLEQTEDALFQILMSFSLYPQSVFTGVLKVISLTVFPVFFLGSLPVDLLKKFGWGEFLGMIAFAAFIFCLSVVIFKTGLKRYESGSSIQVRM